jgi:hypothetical protein
MAKVKSFRIHPQFGVPDKDIREFLNLAEKEGFIAVTTVYIPPIGESDPRLTVIATRLDDYPEESTKPESLSIRQAV